ncbi:MAG TPA: DUF1257 domain-containing protein [Anaerolineaceae bacterium]|nr:DUF1257 domain-containing protein [Anaerolineaceae bacterium]HQO96404.1 DUF1257 domain-containing protein [Anaerolineaceae bacterium]
MSHISRIQTKIKERKYLIQALEDLGYQFEEVPQTVRGYGGQKSSVEIVIKLPLSYDIGLRATPDGYEVVADWFGVRGTTSKQFVNQLSQRYAYHAARAEMEAQGFTLTEEVEEKGEIRLVLRRMA